MLSFTPTKYDTPRFLIFFKKEKRYQGFISSSHQTEHNTRTSRQFHRPDRVVHQTCRICLEPWLTTIVPGAGSPLRVLLLSLSSSPRHRRLIKHSLAACCCCAAQNLHNIPVVPSTTRRRRRLSPDAGATGAGEASANLP